MPTNLYKCNYCETCYLTESQAMSCEDKHANSGTYPPFVTIEGGITLRRCIGDEIGWTSGDEDYFRDAGLWGLACEKKDGKLLVVGRGKTKNLDGMELIPCTSKEYRDDNRGYV